jgi:outer membrane biosynthesis protein TonB
MDRAERNGLGIALIGHVALFAALSFNLLKPPSLPRLETSPVEVALVDEVSLRSTAPEPEPAPAASATAEEPLEAPAPSPAPLPTPAPPPAPKAAARPEPKPTARPETKPAVRPETKAASKPAIKPATKPATSESDADNRPRRRPGLSRDILAGVTPETGGRPSPARSDSGAPAATIGPAVTASIGAEVRRQLKPHWKSPTGADVELLRTTVAARLNRDGSLAAAPELVSQTGVNASNRAQARLHADQAIKAVRLAAPFKLPAEYYEAWREIRPTFDRRLSQ